MIAVDTNVVVRLLTGDDPAQTEQAARLFASETILLPKTVLLETEWVLRSLYGLPVPTVLQGLERLVALPRVNCEDASVVVTALGWARQGLDFADALHLAASHTAERFATFDRKLARRARTVDTSIAVAPP